MAQETQRLMKHGLGAQAIDRLAGNLARVRGSFDAPAFIDQANRGIETLELKQRIVHVAEALAEALPSAYPKALAHILRAAKRWDKGDPDDPLRGFAAWPLFQFIEVCGLEHFDLSMAGLRDLTHLFSAEFAVRPFIAAEPERALALLAVWATDESEQIRRLVSEGTRPRLPWASRLRELQGDPSPIIPLLNQLKDDPSLYVRRSVANNLNDIAKDHPDLVVALCTGWLAGASDERTWVIRRATRTLVKQGHSGVWTLLGYTDKPRVDIGNLALSTGQLCVGEAIEFSFDVRSRAKSGQRMVVDYAVHHVKANGSVKAKVFKLREVSLDGGAAIELRKRHSFRKISTRAYYAGTHRIEVLVNGKSHAEIDFELVC